jgi:hypothetical protein
MMSSLIKEKQDKDYVYIRHNIVFFLLCNDIFFSYELNSDGNHY